MNDIHYVRAAIESPFGFGRTCQIVKGTVEKLAEYFEVDNVNSFDEFLTRLNDKNFIIYAKEITEEEYEHKDDYSERVALHFDLTSI